MQREKLTVTPETALATLPRRRLMTWLRQQRDNPLRNQNEGSEEWVAREQLIRDVSTYLAATQTGTRLKVVESTSAQGIKVYNRHRR